MKKATSVQNIKNVNGVSFLIENHPMEEESKLTIVASTNDDIFEFEFEGSDLLQSCKAAGLFTGWEKDQKIKELDESLGRWKKEAADCLRLRDEAQKEAYKLKKENEKYEEKIKKLEHDDMLDKNAADYWSKEHDILLERFAKLQTENEKLKDKVENAPASTSRADILDQAKMCVCGQREQDYGTPESNFQLIADLWNDYLGFTDPGDKIQATDIAMMMALMKIARIRNGGGSGDSFVDLAGYAACGGEIWYGGKTQVPEWE